MDNIIIDSSSESDSDFSDESGGHSDREEEIYESENFMNHVNKKEYEANRNKIFTKDIETIDIMVDSYEYTNKNNYKYKLFSEDSSTGGHGTYKNIIGISLIRSSIIQASSSLGYKLVDIIINEIPYNACIRNSGATTEYNSANNSFIFRLTILKNLNLLK